MKVVIDGNIGSGKTTQLDMFDRAGFSVFREPIDSWPLDIFYSDISRWALMFQLRVFQTLPVISWDRQTRKIEFYERCHWSALEVFWRYMVQKKQVTEWEDKVLRDAVRHMKCEPDLYIFLNNEPKSCHQAIQNRGQAGDTQIPLDYIKELDVLYKSMYYRIRCQKYTINVYGKTPKEVNQEIINIVSSKAYELHDFDY
jgi:deoxyadenosine/deoxycytidine kinase